MERRQEDRLAHQPLEVMPPESIVPIATPSSSAARQSQAGSGSYHRPMAQWLDEAKTVDAAVYAAIAGADVPALDSVMRRLTRTADHSKLWFGTAAGLALLGGLKGRRAAGRGLLALSAASALANLVAKPLTVRSRPQREEREALSRRHVPMPRSSSFPSGHAASAFAFATAVGHVSPALSAPLRAAATLVGYSRVHTGVHFPADVLAGAFLGVSAAEAVNRLLGQRA